MASVEERLAAVERDIADIKMMLRIVGAVLTADVSQDDAAPSPQEQPDTTP